MTRHAGNPHVQSTAARVASTGSLYSEARNSITGMETSGILRDQVRRQEDSGRRCCYFYTDRHGQT